MDIYDTIQAHATSIRLPLYAVTLSAAAKARTPVLLILHWHGFRRDAVPNMAADKWPWRAVAGSAVQLNKRWNLVEDLDEVMLDAAWKLGAWELERTTYRPWWRLNAPLGETLACHRAFGDYPGNTDEKYLFIDAPAQSEMLELAATRGYVRWLFRPRSLGIWRGLEDDDATLDEGEVRTGDCPIRPAPHDRHRPGTWLYRLGRAARIYISKRSVS